MKVWKRTLPILLAVLTLVVALPLQTFAAGYIDLTCTAGLTIQAICGETPVAMPVKGYLVARVDATGSLTATEQFAQYADQLQITGKNDSAWQALAQTVAQELTETVKPQFSGTTDEQGTLTQHTLPLGLYLITGQQVRQGGYFYEISPFFVMLPQQSENDWQYTATVYAKPSQTPCEEEFRLLKKWDDSCHSNRRPKKISVRILCNGELYETVTLPYNGKWSYTWKGDINKTWTVEEDQVTGYRVPKITQEGYVFTILNRCDDPEFPQTGQLWWPVPVLICCGLALIAVGLLRRKEENHEA